MELKDLSPIAGLAASEGALNNLTKFGALGAVADLIRRKREEKDTVQPGTVPTGTPAPTGMKKGGKVSSASKRADGCCVRGKTRGKMV